VQLASGAGPLTRRASFVASRAGCGTRSRSWPAWRTPSAWCCTVDDERARDIWGPAGAELLAALFLADRFIARRLGQNALAVTLILTVKLLKWTNRWNGRPHLSARFKSLPDCGRSGSATG